MFASRTRVLTCLGRFLCAASLSTVTLSTASPSPPPGMGPSAWTPAPCAWLQGGVSGTVRDAVTLQPLADARVAVQAANEHVTTDANGAFTLGNAQGTNLVIVAALKGYANASTVLSSPASGVTLMLDPVLVGNNSGYQLRPPANCGTCHPDQFAQWTSSPMANAGTNTWVYDLFDGTGSPGGVGGFVYTRDSVHTTHSPNSDCAACHQPEPWIVQPFIALEPIQAPSQGALHGVSCEVCHKVADIDESKLNFPGIFPGVVTFNRPPSPLTTHQVQYGVLGDSNVQLPGLMRPSYQPQLVAEVCAACHQDKNDPDGNGNFEEPNGVVSEPTYFEWKNSAYADEQSPHFATCVDCHMPAYGATHASNFGTLAPQRDPATIRSHAILGTTPEFLESAATLTVELERDATGVDVHATVENTGTGHHVPTGVTVRNVILLVEAVRTSDGGALNHVGTQVVHPLGGVGPPAQGYYAGLPGKLFANVNHDQSGAGPVFFTEATGVLFDSRIPALGADVTHYRFEVPPGTGEVEVRARLIYRRAFRAVVDAKQWTTDGHGNPLGDLAAPHYGHLMESLAARVQDPTGPGVAYCASGPNSSGAPALLSATGTASIASNDLVLTASNLPLGTVGLFFLGTQAASQTLGNGTRCVSGRLQRFPTFGPTPSSVVHQSFDVVHAPGGIQVHAGDTLHFQCWFRDAAAPGIGVDLSDGYRVTFLP